MFAKPEMLVTTNSNDEELAEGNSLSSEEATEPYWRRCLLLTANYAITACR